MPERNDTDFLETYRKHKLTPKKATLMSAGMGLFYGGISYGVTYLAAGGEIAEKVGIGFGGGIAGAGAGLYLGIETQARSQELAIKGEPRKALLKMAQSSTQAAIGFGLSGAVIAFEASGIKGAVIGGVIGTFTGAVGLARSANELNALGRAYRDVIIPTQDSRNFPNYHVIKSELFDENDVLSKYPLVYQAATFSDLKGFRKAQVDSVVDKSSQMSGFYKFPENILARIPTALFIIPGITHYPAFDPQDAKHAIHLKSIEDFNDEILAYPFRETKRVWPYSTVFQTYTTFDEHQWNYWKDKSWKYGIVLLAERTIIGGDASANGLNVEDKYYLIDILVSGPDRRNREDEKEVEKARRLIPLLNPG